MTAAELVDLAARLLNGRTVHKGRSILGLTGPPGAGKSTLALHLVTEIDRAHGPGTAAYLPLDGFHLANAQLDRLGLRHRKGSPPSFDAHGYVALLRRAHAERFTEVYAPGFDRTLDEPVAGRHAIHPHTRLVITEGNYLANTDTPWAAVRSLLHELWYLSTPAAVRDERLMHRHVSGGRTPEAARAWIDGNDGPNGAYVEEALAMCTRAFEVGRLPSVGDGRTVL
ncbi:nucleoside/nucleotide kinase family protein [Kitasatospora sp. NPDC096147]|uniref:nucleoside/nucleotide kinase family protein n=1 Tax=Kitasatospora sp. NPDC096147 TaxID=3364093 RepID=UPI003805ABB6